MLMDETLSLTPMGPCDILITKYVEDANLGSMPQKNYKIGQYEG